MTRLLLHTAVATALAAGTLGLTQPRPDLLLRRRAHRPGAGR
ncbi:hypothetical protein [Streptomyces afghaniensis]|nr:hypothetical protein [Streptomyces afghaniensis]